MTIDAMADFYTETSRLIKVALSATELSAVARRLDGEAFRRLPDGVQEDLLTHYAQRIDAIRRA